MVRSHRRRFGAALLATVLCGMLAMVDPRPAAAVTLPGDFTDMAMYVVSFNGNVMRIGPDGNVSYPATGLGFIGQGIAATQDGTFYLTSPPDQKVWKIAPGGSPAAVPFTATVDSPQDVAVDDTDALYTLNTGASPMIVRRASNGSETTIPFSATIVSAIAVDHDGSHIYLLDVAAGEILRMDADGGNRTVIADSSDILTMTAMTIDDQDRIYAGTADGHIYRITPGPSSTMIDDLTSAAGNVTDVAVADNGEIFATRFTSTDVVRVHSDGSVEQMAGQLTTPIGLLVRTVPAPPTTVTATAGSGSADVEWDAGQTNGGLPIVRYTAVSDPGGLTCTPIVPTDTHCTVTGLTDGLAYTFRVVASNTMGSDGESLLSPASGSVIPGPATPTSFQATPADGAADISFVPGAPGGDPNQSFETSIDNEVSWQPLTTQPGPGGTLTGTVANLPTGVQSTILLRARTSAGNSPNASATVTATSPSPSPSPSSSSPSPSPSPSPSASSPPTTSPPATTPAPSPSTTSPSPSPSPSPTSASPSPSPTPTATVPNPPTGVTATGGTSSVEVSWQPPADNGVAITGYRAIADPGPAVCTTTTGATSCLLGGAAGTSYRVRVVALSAKGISKLSAYSNAAVPTAPTVATTPPVTGVPLNTDRGQISTTTPGQGLTLVGSGYAAYSTVTLTVYSAPTVLAQTKTDENGTFRQTVTVPGDLESGKHSFTAAGVDPGGKPRTMRMDVTVRPATSELPVTGTAVMWLIVTGLGLTMAGAGLRLVRR